MVTHADTDSYSDHFRHLMYPSLMQEYRTHRSTGRSAVPQPQIAVSLRGSEQHNSFRYMGLAHRGGSRGGSATAAAADIRQGSVRQSGG